jgi:hypothetical protein
MVGTDGIFRCPFGRNAGRSDCSAIPGRDDGLDGDSLSSDGCDLSGIPSRESGHRARLLRRRRAHARSANPTTARTTPRIVNCPWPLMPDPCIAPVPCRIHTAPTRHSTTPAIPRDHTFDSDPGRRLPLRRDTYGGRRWITGRRQTDGGSEHRQVQRSCFGPNQAPRRWLGAADSCRMILRYRSSVDPL